MDISSPSIFGRLRRQWFEQQRHAVWCYLPRFLLALLTLALLGAATWVVTWPTGGMTWVFSEGRILTVAPNGPGAQAGLRPGDVVLAVDGHPFIDVPLYAGYHPGETVILTVQRGANIRDVTLRLTTPDRVDLLWVLIPVVVALTFWGTAVVIFLLRPAASTPRAFFLLGQVAALTLTTGQLSAFNVAWASRLFNLALCALPPLLVYFYGTSSSFPFSLRRRWWAPFLFVSLLLAFPYLLWPLSCLRQSGWYADLRWAVHSYLGLTLLAVMGGLVYIYITTRSGDLRRRLRGLAFGTVAGFVPLIFLSLLPEMMWDTGIGLPYQVSFLFLMLIPLIYAYVIVQRDLIPLDRFLNRSLVIFTLGLLWAGLYLATMSLGMLFFHDTPLLQPVVGALVTMGMAATFMPLRELLQRMVDHLFYGGWYDYRTVIARVSHALSGVTSRQELAEQLVGPVVEKLRLQGAALYLRAAEGDLALENSLGLDVPAQLPAEAVMAWTEQAVPPFPCPPSIWGEGQSVIREDAGIAWVLPLVLEGKLLGLLLLGEKREDDFFEPADTVILHTLGEQATLAAENVLLMDDLRGALAALELAQRRLLTAREEERRILAWELHDGPVQDLVALGYRLCECRDRAWQHEPALAKTLEDVRLEATRIMAVVRDACSELRSDVLDVLGIGPAMQQYACDVMQKTGVVIYLDVPRRGPKLADPLGITLLRVFQEAVGNAVQHARVQEVWTYFQMEKDAYELRVWDEGQGFAVPKLLELLALQGRFGLVTMKERAELVQAHLEVCSAPGQGTAVRMWGQVYPPEK